MKLSDLLQDAMTMSILYTLLFNITIALLYMLLFVIIKNFCSRSARDKAKLIYNRRTSFMEYKSTDQEKVILKDIFLDYQTQEKI